MKKIYAASMALAVALAANAAPIEKSVKVESMSQEYLKMEFAPTAARSAENAGAPAKAVSSIDDLAGLKEWSCVGWLGGPGNEKYGPRRDAVYFTKLDETTILMNNFPWAGKETKMLVNISAKTVTIMGNQQVGENGTGGDMVYLYVYNGSFDDEGDYIRGSKQPSVKGSIKDDGSIVFPEGVGFGASDPTNEAKGSFYYLDSNNVFKALSWNTPVASDYESAGVCPEFLDGWFNPLFEIDGEEPIVDTDVELLRNKTNKNLIALKNPYNNSAWVEEFGMTMLDSGYILLDVSDPDWVQVVPLVGINVEAELSDGSVNHYYPYNEEGLYVWQGVDYSSIKEEWQLFDVPISNMTDGEINLYHLWFGLNTAPVGGYWWTAVPKDFTKHAYVKLPDGFGGIEGVASDMVDGPVKYYNLQGVEVAAPVKGELTIKTQGNKTTKFIAR